MLLLIEFLILYMVMELLYFRLASKFDILDKPNHRSSHSQPTVRGGGVIFPVAFLIPILVQPIKGSMLMAGGIIALAVVSFIDDVKSVDSKIRFIIQACVVALLVWQKFPSVYIVVSVIVLVCAIFWINIFNFMDGINGITGMYSIVTIGSFYWIDINIQCFLPEIYFVSLLAALFVFLFFNVRKFALCFSGDVGSISMAYIICFFMILICMLTGSYLWLFMISIYAIDGGFTIICRLLRKENIFEAHRSHFYQFLANELKWNHTAISALYAGSQLLLNVLAVLSYLHQQPILILVGLFVFLLIYVTFRFHFEGKKRLFGKY